MNDRVSTRSWILATVALALIVPAGFAASEIPRTPTGKPDLTGMYDIATLTPMQRPAKFGDNLYLTPEEAAQIEREEQEQLALGAAASDPNRAAPELGGAAPVGLGEDQRENLGAGNVGGYNNFWIDRGDSVVTVDGKFRTSIITDPANGREPAPTPQAMRAFGGLRDLMRPNDGTAFWAEWDRPGPYDNMEQRPFAERCLNSFARTIPAAPALYNNFKRIVQTEDTVMILNEMVHDVRIVRMNAEHAPADVKLWMGDSIGWWEGDTLVVETTNFLHEPSGFSIGNVDQLKVTERFTRQDEKTVHYAFEVENPERWVSAWKGDYTWPQVDEKLFEYACHEGNYALGNIMRGARVLEEEALSEKGGETDDD